MVVSAKDKEVLDGLLAEAEGLDSPVLFLLHRMQEHWGHVNWDIANYVADSIGVPLTQLYSAVTFYEEFSLEMTGKYVVHLCRGVVCHARGSREISEGIREYLGIHDGETTADGLFTLRESSCIGQCDGSPAMMVNERVHRELDLDRAIAILKDLGKGGE
ncbi:MAG: NAD(P)H-dependent oxidoreductase subunit E [Thermoplasmatota archaeon]